LAAGSLLTPEPALAAEALFRVERKWYGAPFPPATSPGGAGVYEYYIEPFTYAAYAEATVEPGNPIGGAFTLPSGFIEFFGSYSPHNTEFPGYTTRWNIAYYNGPGRFGPSNPHAATMTARIVFPTTMGNPTPNLGAGNPVAPTTTFSGRYDVSRAGSIHVTPGPRRFGGTMQIFHRQRTFWYQYISYFAPAYYKVYGSYRCQDPPGVTCTPSVVSSIGDITSSVMVTRFLLNVTGTGTGTQNEKNTAKATMPIDPTYGTFPTRDGNASYIAAKSYFLHTIHPWTTGFASAHNPLENPTPITPQLQGYDISLGGADITVTHTYTSAMFNSTLSTVTYTQQTYKQYMEGVGRVVSLVRPRLLHAYAANPISSNIHTCRVGWHDWPGDVPPNGGRCAQAARLFTMKVFFVPEAAEMLLLGLGIALLLALSRMRRR
jgi:hypothetical protein